MKLAVYIFIIKLLAQSNIFAILFNSRSQVLFPHEVFGSENY